MKFIKRNIVCLFISLLLILAIIKIMILNNRVDELENEVKVQQDLMDFRKDDFLRDILRP